MAKYTANTRAAVFNTIRRLLEDGLSYSEMVDYVIRDHGLSVDVARDIIAEFKESMK